MKNTDKRGAYHVLHQKKGVTIHDQNDKKVSQFMTVLKKYTTNYY